MGNEIWLPIKDFEGLYEVSNFGRIKSLDRMQKCREGVPDFFREGRIMIPVLKANGYYAFSMKKNGLKYQLSIHRAIATAFIPNPENKREVNHINGIKSDNRLENLEWVTRKENTDHAFKNGLIKPGKGATHYNSKIVLNLYTGIFYDSKTEAANVSGYSLTHFSEMLRGRRNNNTQFALV